MARPIVESPEWIHLAASLGFTPYETRAQMSLDGSFRQLRRALAAPASRPVGKEHWLHGVRNGREALVVNYWHGSGDNPTNRTAIVMELAPPLWLGATIGADGSMMTWAQGPDIPLNILELDQQLRLGALDPAALVAMLTPRDNVDLMFLHSLARAVDENLRVTDSTVYVEESGVVSDPAFVAAMLDRAAWVATELAHRRQRVPLRPAEVACRAEWKTFADARGLVFDPARMTLSGMLDGVAVDVALETNRGQIQTTLSVAWPRSLGVGLRVTKTGELGFLTGLFEQDIKTGDKPFDKAFQVQGEPEDRVRALLSSPELRALITEVARDAIEIVLSDTGVFWALSEPAMTAATLEAQVGAAVKMAPRLGAVG